VLLPDTFWGRRLLPKQGYLVFEPLFSATSSMNRFINKRELIEYSESYQFGYHQSLKSFKPWMMSGFLLAATL
jgi:hypothetical protein